MASSPRFSPRHAFSTVTLLAPSIAHAEVQVSTVGFTSIQVKFQSGQSSTAGVKALRVRFTAQSAAGLASTACWSDDTPGRSSGIGLGRRRLCSSLASLRQSRSAPDLKSRGRLRTPLTSPPPSLSSRHPRKSSALLRRCGVPSSARADASVPALSGRTDQHAIYRSTQAAVPGRHMGAVHQRLASQHSDHSTACISLSPHCRLERQQSMLYLRSGLGLG